MHANVYAFAVQRQCNSTAFITSGRYRVFTTTVTIGQEGVLARLKSPNVPSGEHVCPPALRPGFGPAANWDVLLEFSRFSLFAHVQGQIVKYAVRGTPNEMKYAVCVAVALRFNLQICVRGTR